MKSNKAKYACPCCGYLTLDSPIGNFDICPVCYWEADLVQSKNPNLKSGPNNLSLKQAKENFVKFGASQKKFVKYVRKPTKDEK